MRRVLGVASLLAVTFMLILLALGGSWLVDGRAAQPVRAQSTPATIAAANVTLAHYAPFAADPLSTSVTIRIQGGPVLTDVVFADKVGGVGLPAGAYTVEVVPTGTVTPVLTASTTLSDGVDYTLAVIGGENGWPLDLFVLPATAPPLTTTAQLRVSHLSPFTTTLPATAVDICTADGTVVPGLAGLVYGETSEYLSLPPGAYALQVAVAGTSCATQVLALPPIQLAPGQVADLFAVGLPGAPDLPFRVDASGLQARAAFSHFAPFAAAITSTAVTVRVNGTDLITGFVYGDVAPYVDVPLGDLPVEIIPTGTTTPVLTGTAVISGYLDYTFAVIGDEINQPLALRRFVDDNVTPPPAGKGRIRLAHLAPIAKNLVATRVDVCYTVDKSILVDDLAYGDEATLTLTAGLQQFYVSAGALNCALPLIDVPLFYVADGQIAAAYAVGNLVFQPPSVVVIPDLTPQYRYLPQTFD